MPAVAGRASDATTINYSCKLYITLSSAFLHVRENLNAFSPIFGLCKKLHGDMPVVAGTALVL
jgi:hypothetical protein